MKRKLIQGLEWGTIRVYLANHIIYLTNHGFIWQITGLFGKFIWRITGFFWQITDLFGESRVYLTNHGFIW